MSKTTIDMLLTKYDGVDNGTNIDNIEIVSVLGRLEADLSSTGGRLFCGGSQAAIATFASQHPLLTKEMAVRGDLTSELLCDLPWSSTRQFLASQSRKRSRWVPASGR